MRVIVATIAFLLGARFLWAAFTGETVYYASLGHRPDHERPMPTRRGKIAATLLGLYCILFSIVAVVGPLLRK